MSIHETILEISFLTNKPKSFSPIWKSTPSEFGSRVKATLKDVLKISFIIFMLCLFSASVKILQTEVITNPRSVFFKQVSIVGFTVGVFYCLISLSSLLMVSAKHLIYAEKSPLPSIDQPWASRSVRELWSVRWRHLLTYLFKKALFEPLAVHVGVTVAAGLVFLLSGLLHELQFILAVGKPCGSQLAFFMLHYFATLLQTVFSPFYKKIVSFLGIRESPFLKFLEILFTLSFIVFTVLIFVDSFFDQDFFTEVYMQVPLNPFFDSVVSSILLRIF